MMKHCFFLRSAAVTLAAASALSAAADDSMRCSSGRLINVGMAAAEILGRCGEPKSKTVEDLPVRAQGAGGGAITVTTTRVERWVVARGQGQFDALLTFEDGELTNIELLTSR